MSSTGMSVAEYNATIAAQMRESVLQTRVEALARSLGWLAYHTHSSIRSAPGFPDLVMVRRQRLVAAELKSARGAVTDPQRQWLTALAVAGAEVHIWRPIDLFSGAIADALTNDPTPDGA